MKQPAPNLFCFLSLICVAMLSISAQAPRPVATPAAQRQQLNALVAQLKQTADDEALREKIVRLAASMHPAPAIPEEARKLFVQASALQKQAQTAADVAPAIDDYKQGLLLAPWWADGYYDLSSALELAGRYSDAIDMEKIYLASNPKDARQAQDHLYALQALEQKAAATQQARAQAAAEEQARLQAIQQQKQAAEAAAAQKLRDLQLKKAGMGALRQRVQGMIYNQEYVCYWRNPNPIVGGQVFPTIGCNQSEMNGNNWYQSYYPKPRGWQFYFLDNGTVKLGDDGTLTGKVESGCQGTPNGPAIEDIVWKCGDQLEKDMWMQFSADGTQFIFSCGSRPTNDADFNPETRYLYVMYRGSR